MSSVLFIAVVTVIYSLTTIKGIGEECSFAIITVLSNGSFSGLKYCVFCGAVLLLGQNKYQAFLYSQ